MDALARFRLEAAKTRPCRLCNTTLRISHWIDWHSALATISDAERYVIASMPCAIADPLPTVRRNCQSKWHYAEPPSNIARSATLAATSMCLSLASHDLASRSVRVTKISFGFRFS